MKYLTKYKLFEHEVDDIDDQLKELLANLVDDGFSVSVEHPRHPSQSGFDIDVTISKVTGTGFFRLSEAKEEISRMIEFSKSNLEVFHVIGYGDSRCDDGHTTFNNRRYNSFDRFVEACGSRLLFNIRVLFKISKVNEDVSPNYAPEASKSYIKAKGILEDVKNICYDLSDDGFRVDVNPSDDISIKVLGLNMIFRNNKDIPAPNKVQIEITIRKMGSFYIGDILPTTDRLAAYLKEEDFECKAVHYVTEVSDRLKYGESIWKYSTYDKLKTLDQPTPISKHHKPERRKFNIVKLLFYVK